MGRIFDKNRGSRSRGRFFIGFVCVPALAAGLFLWHTDRKTGGGHLQGSAQQSVALQAGQAGGPAEGAEVSSVPIRLFGSGGEKRDAAAIQKLAFTAGGSDTQQRSLPVSMDASAFGGEKGETAWAVFLPAEMAKQPHVVFEDFERVTFEPVEGGGGSGKASGSADGSSGGDGGSGSVDGSSNGDAGGSGKGSEGGSKGGSGSAGSGRVSISSGKAVSGLKKGGVYTVYMEDQKGGVQEETLHVFSCTGTATMYLDTMSGSMESIDEDEDKQTSEAARYLVFSEGGALDSAGLCSVRGRGNSTWNRKKRPYNLDLEKKQSVLGMEECKKLCLLSNSFDETNLLDRISAQLADSLQMRDTPDGEFVNVYLNGVYNGLYYLSQRVRTGGSVHIDKLNDRILLANMGGNASSGKGSSGKEGSDGGGGSGGGDSDRDGGSYADGSGGGEMEDPDDEDSEGGGSGGGSQLPKKVALRGEGESLQLWAYDWKNEPADNSGGYLLEVNERYNEDDCWFDTKHKRFRIISPSYPTPGEVSYLQDCLLKAERAVYSEDGTDPESGLSYDSILDMASWEDMFLLEELFVEWDAERWSFYLIKDRKDPLFYCGPMWDFDHGAGTMLYGTYPETAVSTLLFKDDRGGWMNRLLSHEGFAEAVRERWRTRFSPALHSFLEGDGLQGKGGRLLSMEKEAAAIESAAYMNNVRRSNVTDYRTEAEKLRSWLVRRTAFLDDYFAHPEEYCRVLFKFKWGKLSHYVKKGEVLGFLPLPEYGETQIPSQIEKNEILGWVDEDGNVVSADVRIDEDRTFKPVYRE